MTFEEIIAKVRLAFEHANARNIFEHVAVQVNMEGDNGGTFYIEIADRQICVEPYDYYDKDGLITTTPDVVCDIADRKISYQEALDKGYIDVKGDIRKLNMLLLIELPSIESVQKRYDEVEKRVEAGIRDKQAELIRDVERARRNGEIKAYYQPQFDSITGKLTSAEALVRWIRPDGQVVLPGDFIPELEKSDKICDIDWHVLEEACTMLKKQQDQGIPMVPIAVNFSRRHTSEYNFATKLSGIVDSYGIPHKYIEVEITETAYIDDPNSVINWIKTIREKDFKIAVDDFGSGLSSLSFLTDINADILKIDRSLIKNNCEDEKERIILESIFSFAHRLRLTTVAEGVENDSQLGFMRTCDCQLIQGFLFSRPIPEEEFLEICRSGSSASESDDILTMQGTVGAMNLLTQVIFEKYPLVIFSNLTRNSYYMMTYDHFSSTSCPATGNFEELIEHGTQTMHEADKQLFHDTFDRQNLLKAYEKGEKYVRVVTRQRGDDGIYRKVETVDYFVKHPSVDDVLVITLCQNVL